MNVGQQMRKLGKFGFTFLLPSEFNKTILLKRTVASLPSNGGIKKHNGSAFVPLTGYQFVSSSDGLNKAKVESKQITFNLVSNVLDKIINLPTKDIPFKGNIKDPIVQVNLNFGLPVSSLNVIGFELPTQTKKEIVDPTGIKIEKKAENIIRIRRKKMKKKKWKKLQKKLQHEFARIRKRRKQKKELIFQEAMSKIEEEGLNYNAERELEEKIDILKWKRPVTYVYGRLAPQWVVEAHLKKQQRRQMMDERINICLKKL